MAKVKKMAFGGMGGMGSKVAAAAKALPTVAPAINKKITNAAPQNMNAAFNASNLARATQQSNNSGNPYKRPEALVAKKAPPGMKPGATYDPSLTPKQPPMQTAKPLRPGGQHVGGNSASKIAEARQQPGHFVPGSMSGEALTAAKIAAARQLPEQRVGGNIASKIAAARQNSMQPRGFGANSAPYNPAKVAAVKSMISGKPMAPGMKKGGVTASKRADGIATKGKTRGTMITMKNGGSC